MRDEELLALVKAARDASERVRTATVTERDKFAEYHLAVANLSGARQELEQAQAALVAKVCPAA